MKWWQFEAFFFKITISSYFFSLKVFISAEGLSSSSVPLSDGFNYVSQLIPVHFIRAVMLKVEAAGFRFPLSISVGPEPLSK